MALAGNSLYVVDEDQALTAEWLNQLLGDIHTRIRAIEGIKAALESAVADLTAVGLSRIDQTIVPVIEQTQASVEALLTQAQEDVEAIGQQLADTQAQIEALLAGGVPAANVSENETRVFVTPGQRDQIAANLAAIDDLTTLLTDQVAAIGTAMALLAPKDSPSFTGAPAFVTVISPAALAADQNDYNPANLHACMTVRLSAAATRTVTGLHAGRDGEFKLIDNIGAGDLVLANESPASAAANRFSLGADHVVKTGQSLMLRYDASSSRWRAMANVARSGFSAGQRAQFDATPPAPWLALNGGAILNAAYPILAATYGVTLATASNGASIAFSGLPGLSSVLAGSTCVGLHKGLGFYWAFFWKLDAAPNYHTLQVFKTANMLSGPWTEVFTSTDIIPGVTAGSALSDQNLQPRGAFNGAMGLFTFGATLIVLEAAAFTIRKNFFAGSWSNTHSKSVCYHEALAYWVFMDGASVSTRMGTLVEPKAGALVDRGVFPGSASMNCRRLVYFETRIWALNINNNVGAPIFISDDGYIAWSSPPAPYNAADPEGLSARDIAVINGKIYVMFYGTPTFPRIVEFSSKTVFATKDGGAGQPQFFVDLAGPNGTKLDAIYDAGGGHVFWRSNSALSYTALVNGFFSGVTLGRSVTVFDEVNSILWVASSTAGHYRNASITPNPVTQTKLPSVASTPPTYVYGG